MLECDYNNVIELTKENINDMNMKTLVACASIEDFFGNHKAFNEGDVYFLTIDNATLHTYHGNIKSGFLNKNKFEAYKKSAELVNKFWDNIAVVVDPEYSIFIYAPRTVITDLKDSWFRGEYYTQPEKNLIDTVYKICCEYEGLIMQLLDTGITAAGPIKCKSNTDELKKEVNLPPSGDFLISLFEKYPDVWKEPKRFKALLMDYIPSDKVRRNLLIISIEEHIPDDIRMANEITEMLKNALKNRLIKASGCQDVLALEVISLWIDALSDS